MPRITDPDIEADTRQEEVGRFLQGLDLVSEQYLKLPEVARDKVFNSAVWQVLGTITYGLRAYAEASPSVVTPFVTMFLGSYVVADVSERVAGKDMNEVQKARLQTGLAALQGIVSTAAFATSILAPGHNEMAADAIILLYTGITAYVHLAHDDKKPGEPPQELVQLQAMKVQLLQILGGTENQVIERLNHLVAGHAALLARHEGLKSRISVELGVDGYDSDDLVTKTSERKAKLAQHTTQQEKISALARGYAVEVPPEGVVKEVSDALKAKDSTIAAERATNAQIRDLVQGREVVVPAAGVVKEVSDVLKVKDATIAAGKKALVEQKDKFAKREKELTGKLDVADKKISKYEGDMLAQVKQSKSLQTKLSTKTEQVSSQAATIDELNARIREMEQRERAPDAVMRAQARQIGSDLHKDVAVSDVKSDALTANPSIVHSGSNVDNGKDGGRV